MTKKVQTTKIGGGAVYAKVNSRMLEFRADNPKGKIDTKPEYISIGEKTFIQFKATIIKDKSDETSAEASGHARLPEDSKQKTFEKCETIAVGRALAFLGYGADGEIASSEEMEEFEDWKETKRQEQVDEAIENLQATKTLKDLQTVWGEIDGEIKKVESVEKIKNELKSKYAS